MCMQISVLHEHECCSGLKVWHSWRMFHLSPHGAEWVRSQGCHWLTSLTTQSLGGWGVACGAGKSTDVPLSFCLLLLSPFPVLNLVNTCCSYNMLSGHPSPVPPMLLFGSTPQAPSLFAPHPSNPYLPHYASGQLRNNGRGYRVRSVVIPTH